MRPQVHKNSNNSPPFYNYLKAVKLPAGNTVFLNIHNLRESLFYRNFYFFKKKLDYRNRTSHNYKKEILILGWNEKDRQCFDEFRTISRILDFSNLWIQNWFLFHKLNTAILELLNFLNLIVFSVRASWNHCINIRIFRDGTPWGPRSYNCPLTGGWKPYNTIRGRDIEQNNGRFRWPYLRKWTVASLTTNKDAILYK